MLACLALLVTLCAPTAARSPAQEPTLADIARSLPEGSVAVDFLVSSRATLVPPLRVHSVVTAFRLLPNGSSKVFELGPRDELEELAHAWRAAVESSTKHRTAEGGEPDPERKTGDALRERVLDPVLAGTDGEVRTLHLSLDSFLHRVPFGALPFAATGDDQRVGDRYEIVYEQSLKQLARVRPPLKTEPSLLVVGGMDFNATVEEAALPHLPQPERRSFAPLPETRLEAERVRAIFAENRGDESEAALFTKAQATKAAFLEAAPGKRYIHLATHGWFAARDDAFPPEPPTVHEGPWSPVEVKRAVVGRSSLTLCGLAFAGANQGPDPLGRVPGILTAEELVEIDLSSCELAVLSASESAAGIRRAGQDVQSLQTSLHTAGVRTAITSLWKIDHAQARRLMERLYTYLWVEELPKAEALWRAQQDLREEGAAVRDWAGWVLSGDPE